MKTIVSRTVDSSLKANNFIKKSGSWYREVDESVMVVNLQKSNYGNTFYINLGVWFKRFGQSQFPKEQQCHIRIRLSSLTGEELDNALNLENTAVTEVDRQLTIDGAISQRALPFLSACSTVNGVRSMLSEGRLKKAFVHKDVKAMNEVDPIA